MSDVVELKAEERSESGSSAARTMRKSHHIPGIIYGGKKKPQMITVDRKSLWKEVSTGHFLSTIYMLDIAGKKERVIPRDVQLDPVRDFLLHVDFMRVSKGALIDVAIPVHFVDEAKSPGLKRGGTMNIVRHEIELSCPADAIPETIEVSLEGLDIGDAVHISNVTLPEGANPTIQDRDFTILTIVAASSMKADDEEDDGAEKAEAEADEKDEDKDPE